MYKKIKIFCGPNTYNFKSLYFEEANEFLVGIDSGLEYLLNIDKKIDLAVGDFDSINLEVLNKIKSKCNKIINLEKDKNMTDLAYALDYIYNNMDYDDIEVYGGISGRIDHLLANLNLIHKYDFSLRDDHHNIFMLTKGKHKINNFKKYVSFFALEDVFSLTLQGFKFNLDSYYLSTNDSLCVSNEGSGVVEFNKGKLLVVMSDDR
ncbi:MAG: thiamine diphosphokinase [Candidatus Izemoplasmatales bacterium]|nr:thiamine diphosphokinase [Candidatus Izemoplasmatales bacterium]